MIKRAVNLLKNAEKPIIITGGGAIASGASENIVKLSQKYRIPTQTTINGIGAISNDKDTYILKSASNTETLAKSLRDMYPSALISRLGSQITVTGDILKTQELLDTAKGIDRNGLAVECQTPNLVDAMNYFLKVQQV